MLRSATAVWMRYRSLLRDRFSQDVLWNIGSLAFLAVGGVVINTIIVRLRTAEALGVFNQIYAIYIVLSQVGVGGLQHSVLKHVSYNQDNRPLCGDITSSALVLIVLIMVPMSMVAALLSDGLRILLNSPDVTRGMLLAIPGLVFFAMNKVLINTLNGLRHMRAYAIFRSIRFILLPIALIVLMLSSEDNALLALSLTVVEVLLFVSLTIYVYGRIIPLKPIQHARQHFAAHLSFGARGFLSGVLLELNTRVDVLMLGFFTTDALVGVFSFPAILAEGFSQLPLALRWNIDPLLGAAFAKNEQGTIPTLAHLVRRIFVPIMAGIGLIAVMGYPLGYALLVGSHDGQVSWLIFSILMVGVIVNAAYRPFAGIVLQGGRPGLYTLLVLGLVLANVVLNALLIPILSVFGAAIATMLTYCMEALFVFVVARKVFRIHL
jgi:O-antigen/teichoic acid export membrane protein